ncbi:MAG: YihA family ribosome biogenesis GTP-binding protein [Oscillospiraceae bacterium]|nr:YihA family ribosome biogenesis GTP-binding protein [Oscillospiraceae bacterium]
MINIHNASLTISAVRPNQYPTTGYMEFAFAGRSNVGKSSMINKLLNRKSLARVSGTPGKTATINFYNIDDTIYLVDLPGYGYAERSKQETEKWGKMMEDYLRDRETLVQTMLLVDSRHKPTKDDIQMAQWIRHYHDNLIVIATKMDKLKKKEIEPNLERIWETLEMGEDDLLVPFSTKDDEGKYSVWDMIEMMREGVLYPYEDDSETE